MGLINTSDPTFVGEIEVSYEYITLFLRLVFIMLIVLPKKNIYFILRFKNEQKRAFYLHMFIFDQIVS